MEPTAIIEKLNHALALADATGVYIHNDANKDSQIQNLVADIRSCQCYPFQLSATVMSPGFPGMVDGDTITGWCVAKTASGYWLVYQPEQDMFYCFWGTNPDNLGAHGVYGSPLYCWSA
jgi:hypothetical protein